jgi:hypothetical protein
MSPNGGWRRIKIVETTPSRAQEILGGIKNALDRGEPLEKAKQTFINSGYTPQEVQEAVQLIGPQSAKPLNPAKPTSTQPIATPPTEKSSKKTIIIMSIVGAVILVSALVLGIFWNKIFQ